MKECISHHFACDCREETFRAMLKRNIKMQAALRLISTYGGEPQNKTAAKCMQQWAKTALEEEEE